MPRYRKNHNRDFAVIDTETDPFVYNRVPKPFIFGFYNGKVFNHYYTSGELIKFLSPQQLIVYAHNGGRFDFHFLLRHVKSFTEFTIINGRIAKFKIGDCEFRDSYLLIPEPLEAYKKTKINYDWFEEKHRKKYLPKIISYLKDDCVYLYEMIDEFIKLYGLKLTLPSAAMAWFKKENKIETGGRNHHEKFKQWYYGGRAEAFETGIFKKKTKIYDINSAYPFAMMNTHPCSVQFRICKPALTEEIIPQSLYTVDAYSQGAFPQRERVTLTFPKGRSIYHITGHELKAAIDTNTVELFDMVKRVDFRKFISFAGYVTYFYNIKKKHEKGTLAYLFAKRMMNALYGKFAANPMKYREYLTIPDNAITIAKRDENYEFSGWLSNGDVLVSRPLPENRLHFYNVVTAASITGFVRSHLWRAICTLRENGKHVYYCDTDSIMTDGTLDTGRELGQWTLEQTSSILAIAAKKLYAAKSTYGTWKTAHKGVELSPRQIVSIANGATITYNRPAPTFGLTHEPLFVSRKIKMECPNRLAPNAPFDT